MSGKLVGLVLEHAPDDLRPAEFLTLLAISEDARDTDRIARFSDLENLTRRTRLKPGTIRNALSELTRRGLIIPRHKTVHRGGVHQEYTVAELRPEHRSNGRHLDDPPPLRRIQ
jgi:DNA-binding MarR family transcriptional regulator